MMRRIGRFTRRPIFPCLVLLVVLAVIEGDLEPMLLAGLFIVATDQSYQAGRRAERRRPGRDR